MTRPIWLGEDARGWDHVRIHLAVLFHPDLGPYEQYLYALIAAHAEGTTGDPAPGKEATQEDLAAAMGCGLRRVREAQELLVKAGLIETRRHPNRIGQPLIYRLLPPPGLPAPGERNAPDYRHQGSVIGASPAPGEPNTKSAPSYEIPETRDTPFLTDPPGPDLLAADFAESFWDPFPKRQGQTKPGKAKCLERWRGYPETTRALIRRALPNYVAECSGPDGRYPKDPITWLNQKAWEDYQQKPELRPQANGSVARKPSTPFERTRAAFEQARREDGLIP
jgi:hypothetical protein